MTKLIMPELGEGIVKATIACWHIEEGMQVKKDDDIVEVVTDKASFNVPAPCDGILKNIKYKEGQEPNVHDVLAEISSAFVE